MDGFCVSKRIPGKKSMTIDSEYVRRGNKDARHEHIRARVLGLRQEFSSHSAGVQNRT